MSDTQPLSRSDTPQHDKLWWAVIAALVLVAFCLGVPQLHYTAALMIAAILRHKDEPEGVALAWCFTHLRSKVDNAPLKTGTL